MLYIYCTIYVLFLLHTLIENLNSFEGSCFLSRTITDNLSLKRRRESSPTDYITKIMPPSSPSPGLAQNLNNPSKSTIGSNKVMDSTFLRNLVNDCMTKVISLCIYTFTNVISARYYATEYVGISDSICRGFD